MFASAMHGGHNNETYASNYIASKVIQYCCHQSVY